MQKLFILSAACLISCKDVGNAKDKHIDPVQMKIEHTTLLKVADIPLPKGYFRPALNDSFAAFLRNCPLKKDKTVYLFNGEKKDNQSAQFAVLDISVPKVDLQQCADAVMRLRAEFLYSRQRFSEIIFKDNEGRVYQFTSPYNRKNFDNYLLRVFGMCGTASLEKQLQKVNALSSIKPGDVLIRGGFPGHAVIVMDIAENEEHEKLYLLAQSYMPAQDIHILQNPVNARLSPWYAVNDDLVISTPEYSFNRNQLKKW